MAAETDELILAQLMCSRICHDLVGPVGAITTAIELMAEESGGLDREAFAVLERSARDAASRLALFRTAFGYGGGADAEIRISTLVEIVSASAPTGKVSFRHEVTSESGEPPFALPGTVAKLALILTMIGIDALARGGELELHIASLNDGIGLALRAEGPGAAIRDTVRAALTRTSEPGDEISIDARNIHADLAWRLGCQVDAELEVSGEPDSIGIATLIPVR